MNQLLSILTLVGALAAGLGLGRIPAVRAFHGSRGYEALRTAVLSVLVFTMGFRIGRTREVLDNIPTLGLTALFFSLATIAGTLAILSLVFLLTQAVVPAALPSGARRGPGAGPAPGPGAPSALALLKDPLLLLLIIAAGFLSGLFIRLYPALNGAGLITAILYLLLVIIGVGLGSSRVSLRETITHPDLFLLPLGTAAGSIAGGLAVGLALHLRAGTSMALASGFGWYSLSGVILTKLDGPFIGSVAFLSNMLRESMALVLIPLLARTRFPYLSIGAGGATSMDVTLPLIEKNCGPRSVAFAMTSGGVLSLAVPVLVPLLYSIG